MLSTISRSDGKAKTESNVQFSGSGYISCRTPFLRFLSLTSKVMVQMLSCDAYLETCAPSTAAFARGAQTEISGAGLVHLGSSFKDGRYY